jgi:hypothetical protein
MRRAVTEDADDDRPPVREKDAGWRYAPGPNGGVGVAYFFDERSGVAFAVMADGDNVAPRDLKGVSRYAAVVGAFSTIPGWRPMTDAEIDDFQERHARVCAHAGGAA